MFAPQCHNPRSRLAKAEWLAILLSLMVFEFGGSICRAQDLRNTHIATCGQTTVDDNYGPDFASEAKLFLVKLQRIVKNDEKRQLSLLVRYPLYIYGENHKSKIETPAEFIRQYPAIISPDLKRVILAQSSECLFANGQGVMIGDGDVWFQRQQSGQMKIITINRTVGEGNKPAESPKH